MTKMLIIAWREFIETVKTKAFLIGAVIFPLLMIGLILMTEKIMKAGAGEATPLRTIAVVDESGADLMNDFLVGAKQHNAGDPKRPIEIVAAQQPPVELDRSVNDGKIYAYIRVPKEALSSEGRVEIARRDNQMEAGRMLERITSDAITNERYRRHPDVNRDLIREIEKRVEFTSLDTRTGEKTEGRDIMQFMTPFAFMFLLWMGTFGISQGLLTSVIEEKSSRVVEVLLSAVSPMQLMTGKILGLVMVGVLLIAVWLGVGSGSLRSMGLTSIVTADRVIYFVLYFIPAYLLYAAILGAIGSAFNSLKEAQAMVTPVTMFGILPMMFWFVLSQYPHGVFAMVLSFIPPITPFVMIMRLCADPKTPIWQVVATLALLWASVIVMLWIAAKIFRVGILMYGKPPTPRELVRWLRYS